MMDVSFKPQFLLLAHDLTDAAIARRAALLVEGGAAVLVAGFRRTDAPIETVAGCGVVNFGQTYNAGFAHRALSVVRLMIMIKKYRAVFERAEIIIARNLEMLALAVWGRLLFNRRASIVYEVLDIHRLLLRKDAIGFALRAVEGFLSSYAKAVITSSPAFIEHYFKPLSKVRLPILLAENKVPYIEGREGGTFGRSVVNAPPPWVIGWFGMIRCRKSLETLIKIAAACEGRVEVVIRGKPALDQLPDFYDRVQGTKGLKYLGSYSNPQDLETIYSGIHFTWAIDKFEEGMNSTWLLPNRLYEGGLYGAIPIAQEAVETGRFIKALGIGVCLKEPEDKSLKTFFDELTQDGYRSLKAAALAVPPSTWMMGAGEGKKLVQRLTALAKG